MITFRPLAISDLPLLAEWLRRPHVAQWWGAPRTLAELERDYAPRTLEASSTRAYLALKDGAPLGYIQSYSAMASADGWWADERDPGVHGVDQFLADPQALGRGLGAELVRAFVAQLFRDPAVTRVQADPKPGNARAIRCYEKAGFRRVGEVATPDGAAVLMTCDRTAARQGAPMDGAPPFPDPDFEEAWNWRRGALTACLRWQGGSLVAAISTVGREGELAAHPEEAEWLDEAARRVPGVSRSWDPVWTVAPQSALALAAALGVESTWRSLKLPRWDAKLLDRLCGRWRVSAHWPIQGAPLSLEVTSEGVLTGALGLHAAALAALTGLTLEAGGVTVERFEPGRAREVACAVFGWRRDEQSFVFGYDE